MSAARAPLTRKKNNHEPTWLRAHHQRRIALSRPTAHTSPFPGPHTPARLPSMSSGSADHALPSQCSILPRSPTAQISVALLPHTLLSCQVVPLGTLDQALPSQRTIVPDAPTAQTSVALLPHTP